MIINIDKLHKQISIAHWRDKQLMSIVCNLCIMCIVYSQQRMIDMYHYYLRIYRLGMSVSMCMFHLLGCNHFCMHCSSQLSYILCILLSTAHNIVYYCQYICNNQMGIVGRISYLANNIHCCIYYNCYLMYIPYIVICMASMCCCLNMHMLKMGMFGHTVCQLGLSSMMRCILCIRTVMGCLPIVCKLGNWRSMAGRRGYWQSCLYICSKQQGTL